MIIYHLPTIDNTTLLSPPSSDLSIENDVHPKGCWRFPMAIKITRRNTEHINKLGVELV